MTTNEDMNHLDPWEIADDIDGMVEGWEPEGTELPTEAMADPDWVRRRLIALRFVREDLAISMDQFLEERQLLEARITAMFGEEMERLDVREDQVLGKLRSSENALADQLRQYHRAYSAAAVRTGRKPPVSVKMPQGTLTSKKPAVPATITVVDEPAAVAWLLANDLEAMVKPAKPTAPTVDKVKARALVKFAKDGSVAGLANDKGTACPATVMTATAGDRRFSVDTDI